MSYSHWVSPREANLLITGNCNLSCRHCSVLSHGSPGTDMSLQEWTHVLDELRAAKLINLTITGGEPLLREDFSEFLDEVYKRPFRFSINTNGTLITQSFIDSLKRCYSRFDQCMISLDGPDRDTVDAQRGEGVFDSVLKSTSMLKNAGIPFGYYCTVTSLNVDRLGETAALALSTGADWIKFNNFLMAGPGLDAQMIPSQKALNRAAEELLKLESSYFGMIQGTLLEMRKRVKLYRNNELPQSDQRAYRCGGGKAKIAVFPDGRVTPCDHLPDLTLGNLLDQPLKDILTGSRMRAFTDFLNQKRSDHAACSSCIHIGWCTGGCPVEAINTGEDIGYDRHSCLEKAMTE